MNESRETEPTRTVDNKPDAYSSSQAFWRDRSFRTLSDYTLSSVPAWLHGPFQNLLRRAMVTKLAEIAAERPPMRRAVDICCGIGDWSADYAAFADRVTGVDLNEDFIKVAKQRMGFGSKLEFFVGRAEDWTDFDDVQLVGFGGCLMYVSSDDLNALFARMQRDLPNGALVYVRATVVTGSKQPFTTEVGHYRAESDYDAVYRSHGFKTFFRRYSADLVADYVWTKLGGKAPALLPSIASGAARFKRSAVDGTDYCSWVMELKK